MAVDRILFCQSVLSVHSRWSRACHVAAPQPEPSLRILVFSGKGQAKMPGARKCRGLEGRWDGSSYRGEKWLYCVIRGYHPLVLLSLLFVDALRPTVWTESVTVVQGRERHRVVQARSRGEGEEALRPDVSESSSRTTTARCSCRAVPFRADR